MASLTDPDGNVPRALRSQSLGTSGAGCVTVPIPDADRTRPQSSGAPGGASTASGPTAPTVLARFTLWLPNRSHSVVHQG